MVCQNIALQNQIHEERMKFLRRQRAEEWAKKTPEEKALEEALDKKYELWFDAIFTVILLVVLIAIAVFLIACFT